MAMTKQEREQRDAAFELLLADMRGWRKDDKAGEWTCEPVSEPAKKSDLGLTGKQAAEGGLHGDIVVARRRRGWTQKELARRAGTTQPAIARLESGRAQPRMRTLRKLAEVLEARLVVRLEVD